MICYSKFLSFYLDIIPETLIDKLGSALALMDQFTDGQAA